MLLLNLSLRNTDKHLAAVKTVAKFAARSVYMTDAEFAGQLGAYIPAEYGIECTLACMRYRFRLSQHQTKKRWLPR